jgi:hypothetical protein
MSKLIKIKTKKNTKSPSSITFEEFEFLKCSHCGGAHLRACPRIKNISFHASGTINTVEFWEDGHWDDSNILWPENVIEAGEANE